MFDVPGTLVLIALIVVALWLVRRAWGSRRKILKWAGVPVAGLFAILLTLLLVVSLFGFYQLSAPSSHPVPPVKVAQTPAEVARGQYLAQILCAGCHSPNNELPLSGGKNLSDDVGLPLGSLYGANLTRGGDLGNWSDGEILRALRWGVHRSGRALAMPVGATSQLGDADAQAIVTYLRSQPEIKNALPPTSPSILLGILVGAGQFDLSAAPDKGPVIAPPRNATAPYGEYLVNIADCKTCHGSDLTGGKPPAPQGPSLFVIRGWTQEQFITAMRTGVTPNADKMEDVMPWRTIARMDDLDLAAMYVHLHDLPLAQR